MNKGWGGKRRGQRGDRRLGWSGGDTYGPREGFGSYSEQGGAEEALSQQPDLNQVHRLPLAVCGEQGDQGGGCAMVPEGEDGGGARLGVVEIDRYDIRYLISSTDCMLSSRRDSSHLHLISPSLQS